MATGSNQEEGLDKPLDRQGEQSAGVPADGEVEGNAFSPMGGAGVQHWQTSYISRDGLQDRGNIFFAAVEMTRMPMVVTNPRLPDNPIAFANGAFFDLTGYGNEEVVGRNCRFLQGEQTDPRTVDEVRLALKEKRAVAVDILNYRKDGTPFWNALFIGPIFDQEGELLYYFASQMDITERRSNQESYLQAQKMEAIGQLTAGMAHDFNNLLQVINGNLEVAMMSLDRPDMARQQLERAQRAAMRAGKLTQQLLTFARKQRLAPRLININNLVFDFSEMLARTLGAKIDLRLDLRPGLPSCMLDPTHLEMALLNVLINARDAMPDGGDVTVATGIVRGEDRLKAHGLPHGTYVSLCVIDHGKGMSADVLRRATEPFFTTKGPGTGLGLAMVHGFVQQSHGRLELDSHPGDGTKVTMIFPIADNANAGQGGAAPGAAGADTVKPCVLVVEDNDDVRELAEQVLAMDGYAVQSAASGEQALDLLRRGAAVDLLFTDVIMPGGMTGLALVEQANALRPGLPVLVTTGYMDELPQGGRAGGLRILAKPYRQEELLARVKEELKEKR
ncbi:MAG: response regulator [Telluria sp.]